MVLATAALAAALSLAQGQPPQPAGGDAAYYFLVGRYLEGAGKVDAAVAALRKAIELEPGSAEPRAELAALYARQDKARESIDAAEDALKVDPKNREANRVLGTVLAALAEQRQPAHPGDDVKSYPARAMAALVIARGDGTGDLNIDLTLGRLYLDAGRPADAIPLFRRIVFEQPQYGEGWMLLAEAQEASGAAGTAIDTLTQLLQDQPQQMRARAQLGDIVGRHAGELTDSGQTANTRDLLRNALKVAPDDLRLTFVYAQTLAADGRYREVVDFLKPQIEKLRSARARPPQIAMLLSSEGLALQQLHRADEAIAAFKQAVDLAPDDPVRTVLLIQGYSAANQHKEALDAAEQARTKFPKDTRILYQVGAALDRAGRRPEAEKSFRDLIAQDPLDAGALNYLGYLLAERGQPAQLEEAVGLVQRALKVDPDNPSFLDSLGWAYFQQGKLDLADTPLTTAAAKLPANSVIQEHLGDLRQKQKRNADAIAAWQKALDGDGDSIDRGKIQKKIDAAKKGK